MVDGWVVDGAVVVVVVGGGQVEFRVAGESYAGAGEVVGVECGEESLVGVVVAEYCDPGAGGFGRRYGRGLVDVHRVGGRWLVGVVPVESWVVAVVGVCRVGGVGWGVGIAGMSYAVTVVGGGCADEPVA